MPLASPARPPVMSQDDAAVAQARRILQFIRVSREVFPAMRDLADHPGWEIVLNLFIAGRQGRTVSTQDICDLTGTWRPLAIRYIEMLFERGLVDRDVSAEKPDAWALSLTPAAESRLQGLLCEFSHAAPAEQGLGATN